MTVQTPKRIVELWPLMTEEAQRSLIKIAEGIAVSAKQVSLSESDRASIEASKMDFKKGKVLSENEFRKDMDAFMQTLSNEA